MTASPLRPREVTVAPTSIDTLIDVLEDEDAAQLRAVAASAADLLEGRTVWNINSTAAGGGVAEMLRPLLSYSRGAGVDARWVVIGGDERFFEITKRIHHWFHGSPGDGGPLGDEERAHLEAVGASNVDELCSMIRPGDICICHDPQTAVLVPALVERGAHVVWRSHIGCETHDDRTEAVWRFLAPWVLAAHRLVFSREAYVPDVGDTPVSVIPPSIDPLAVKNQELSPERAHAILAHVGILRSAPTADTTYTRRDGSTARVDHVADIVRAGPAPTVDTPVVVQVSRWDPLKDMVGVMQAFADHVDHGIDAHLILAGPNVTGVADDPEGASVLTECIDEWRRLPHGVRARVALVCLPMADAEENAIIVNALQRHATVVVQKSLHEGFGLTVSEAMWKARPVVGGRIGGIVDQIVDGESGLLVDPGDLEACGLAIRSLLEDPARAEAIGKAGSDRVRAEFLAARHLEQYADLLASLLAD